MKVLQFDNFQAEKTIKHGISTKELGSAKNEFGNTVKSAIAGFLKELDIQSDAVTMEQIHGNNIAVLTDKSRTVIPTADGMITNIKNIPLVVLVADCLPILFFDKKQNIIGVAHAGRKGLKLGIIEAILDKFKTECKSNFSDLIVGIGPGIEKKCYEVDGKLIDLRELANEKLYEFGIERKNIENLDICTKCHPDLFYSYRGGDRTERFAAVINLI